MIGILDIGCGGENADVSVLLRFTLQHKRITIVLDEVANS